MLLLKFILAFCGLSYALIIGFGVSAFIDSTVLHCVATIGCYLAMTGIGCFFSVKVDSRRAAAVLWHMEILRTLTGSISIISLYVLSGMGASFLAVIIGSYLFIGVMGFLTGLELPLMLKILSGTDPVLKAGNLSRENMISADLLGSFIAVFTFVFYLFPSVGLIRSLLAVTLFNALAAVFIARRWQGDFLEHADTVLLASLVLTGGALALFMASGPLQSQLLKMYIV